MSPFSTPNAFLLTSLHSAQLKFPPDQLLLRLCPAVAPPRHSQYFLLANSYSSIVTRTKCLQQQKNTSRTRKRRSKSMAVKLPLEGPRGCTGAPKSAPSHCRGSHLHKSSSSSLLLSASSALASTTRSAASEEEGRSMLPTTTRA